jgi:large subunit ribosomal protein L9
MQIILLEKVANLGNLGDRVDVRSGYARNFLLPKGKATLATTANIARFEVRRAELEKAANDALASARQRATGFEGFKLTITAKAGSEGKLFGSIGTNDIADAASAAGQKLERAELRLPNGPLRTVGEHIVSIHLHTDIDVDLPVLIVAEDQA